MLNLLKKKELDKKLIQPFIHTLKHFPSSVREWNNSIYMYNKNTLDLTPSSYNTAMKIIKDYFSLYNKNLEKIIRTKRLLLRFRRLSSNKLYLSKGELKHTNNNVLINIYLYNRQKHNYLSKLKSIYLKNILIKKNVGVNLINVLKTIYNKGLDSLKQVNKDKYLLIDALNILEKNNKYKINTFKTLSNYTSSFYINIINLTMKKLRLYFLYKQLIYLNKSKLNYTYLRLLKKYLENLYNKNVEINLINLNKIYLNSDILFESVRLKLTRNKRKLRNIFNKITDKIKIKKSLYLPTITDNKLNEINNLKHLKNIIFSNIKYKHVTGFRLEARGRLSKRFTASRSVFKLKYKGNLMNTDSSYKGLSSVILRGYMKSNIQNNKLNSKTRLGSFGIKGWLSGN